MTDIAKLFHVLEQRIERPCVKQNSTLVALYNSLCLKSKPTEKDILELIQLIDLLAVEPPNLSHIRSIEMNDTMLQGDIPLGFCPHSGRTLYTELEYLFRHTLVIGIPNSGKTTWLRHMLITFAHIDIPFLVFQKKINQFEHIQAPGRLPIAFFRLHEIRDSFFENHISEDFHAAAEKPIHLVHEIFQRQDSRSLSHKALRILKEKFRSSSQNPTIADFIAILDSLPERKRDANLHTSLRRIFDWLWEKNDVFHASRGMYESIKTRGTVIQYQYGEEYFVWLLAFLTAERLVLENDPLPPQQKQPFFILIDDAQDLMERKNQNRLPPFVNYLNITRENKVGMFLSFQTIEGIEPQALTSVGNFIFGSNQNHQESTGLTRILGLDPDYAKTFPQLMPGQFLLKFSKSAGVVKLQGPNVPVSIPNDRSEWLESNRTKQQAYDYIPWTPQNKPKPKSKPALSPLGNKLIWELINHPYRYATELREQLAVSSSTFSDIVKQLCDMKALRIHTIGKSRFFEITEKGFSLAGMNKPRHKGGAEHFFAIQRLLRCLKSHGFESRTEDQLPGSSHLIDIVARRSESTLAIEYETGESHILQNALECVKSCANKICIVRATTKAQQNSFDLLKNHPHLRSRIENGRVRVFSLRTFEKFIPQSGKDKS